LCRGEFEDGDKKEKYRKWILIALVGQILTAISWTSIFAFVCYYAVFSRCPTTNPEAFTACSELIPGVTEAIVILIVLLKNSMTLKEYGERVYVYPIICHEEMLYLFHIKNDQPIKILHSFATFNGLREEKDEDPGCTQSTQFNIATNYIMLMFFDVASLASVSNLIVVHGASIVETGFRAFPFVIILVVDILSESLILYYHDMPLTRGETSHEKKNKRVFDVARIMQVFVNFAWLGSLLYMIYKVLNLNCVSQCDCIETCLQPTGLDCTSTNSTNLQCYGSLNNTQVGYPFSPDPKFDYNCTVTWSIQDCIHSSPSFNSCVLLGIVLLDSFYQMGQMFFKSYIYPITVPEYVMFMAHWNNNNKELIIKAVGKNEFGPEYDFVKTDDRSTPLLEKKDDVGVELETSSELAG